MYPVGRPARSGLISSIVLRKCRPQPSLLISAERLRKHLASIWGKNFGQKFREIVGAKNERRGSSIGHEGPDTVHELIAESEWRHRARRCLAPLIGGRRQWQ